DGAANAVAERNVKRVRPDARFFTTTYTVFGKSSDAKRRADGHGASSWIIYNPKSLSQLGRPAGYAVVPMDSTPTTFPRSDEKGEQSFTFSQLWATPYREGQLFANGSYPTQAPKTYADTLYHYAANEPIFDRDIVVWYSFGSTHVPRPEDYPL